MESGLYRPQPRYSREMGQVARAGYPTFHPDSHSVLDWGSACLSLNSSCPSGVIIASQARVGATTQSHLTDLPHRATTHRMTKSYITARRIKVGRPGPGKGEEHGGGVPSASRHSP